MRRLIPAAALLAACSGGAAPAPVAPADRVVRYGPDTAQYQLISHRLVEQEFNGQTTSNALRSVTWVSATIVSSTDEGFDARFVVDSVNQDAAVLDAGEVARARGVEFTARLAANGQLTAFSGETTPGLVNQLANGLREFYPRLPPGGARSGATWQDTITSTVDVGGVVLTVTTVNQSVATGWEIWNGVEALLITTRSDYTMEGEGAQSGQPLTLEGEGRRFMREFLSADGEYVGAVAADTSAFEVLLTALGMTIPGSQHSVDTVLARR